MRRMYFELSVYARDDVHPKHIAARLQESIEEMLDEQDIGVSAKHIMVSPVYKKISLKKNGEIETRILTRRF